LLAGHAAVEENLFFQCCGRCHGTFIIQFAVACNFISASVSRAALFLPVTAAIPRLRSLRSCAT
jgi:hypothetical protein